RNGKGIQLFNAGCFNVLHRIERGGIQRQAVCPLGPAPVADKSSLERAEKTSCRLPAADHTVEHIRPLTIYSNSFQFVYVADQFIRNRLFHKSSQRLIEKLQKLCLIICLPGI